MEFLTGLAIAAAIIVAAFAAISVAFIVGMRRKSGLVQGPIIWLGKHGFNKRGLKTAGQPGVATAVVRATGRVSGRTFETPVVAVASGDEFLVALPYGLRSNWLRNVLAAGGAELVHDGHTHTVDRPEIVPMATVEDAFGPSEQSMHRLFNVTEVLRLRRVATRSSAATPTPAIATA